MGNKAAVDRLDEGFVTPDETAGCKSVTTATPRRGAARKLLKGWRALQESNQRPTDSQLAPTTRLTITRTYHAQQRTGYRARTATSWAWTG